jgi:transcriptional regulator with XRE-family HTH domain
MSPISELLHELRLRHGLRQADLAERIGYEQSYISAVEVGLKGPPLQEFLERFSAALSLTQAETAELFEAAEASQRKLVINADAPSDMFLMLKDLREGVDRLSPEQIQLIRDIVKLPTSMGPAPQRIRRLKRKSKEEAIM